MNAMEAREIAKGFLMKSGKSELLTDLQKHFEAKGYLAALEGQEISALLMKIAVSSSLNSVHKAVEEFNGEVRN